VTWNLAGGFPRAVQNSFQVSRNLDSIQKSSP
jgi:hypothetical protein